MRGTLRKGLTIVAAKNLFGASLFVGLLCLWMAGSGQLGASSPEDDLNSASSIKTAAVDRAERRLFDGAPPVIPHAPLGASCVSCHHERGVAVEGLGFSPPSPHELTAGMSRTSRCEQCHVFKNSDELFVQNAFDGVQQDLRRGTRLYEGAPPTMPHARLMRENCRACHSGPAAREEIRTSHPERARCNQCHVEQEVDPRVIKPFPPDP